jgi:imidazolonepropionase-like amidohydrolase
METLHRFFPNVSPEIILKMGTLWGARALKHPRHGAMESGCLADLIAFPAEGVSQKEIYEFVVSNPKEKIIRLYG